jgi:very-short-patch-repair endonuclease
MITCYCKNCGKEFKTFECTKKKFCGHDCWYEYSRKQHDEEKIKKCKFCQKEFRPKDKHQKFCSTTCADKFHSTQVGELSPNYKQVEVICESCGKRYKVKPSKVGKQRFCCYKCFNDWQRIDKEYKSRMTEVLIKNKTDGKMLAGNTMTKPHRIVMNELDKLNIKYECEYPVDKYLVDIYLVDYNIMVEVMGDYWHSNPELQYDISGKVQKERTARDTKKHDYVKENYNTELLYIWENDIIKNLNLCIDIILQTIKNNGKMEDYNSFNYEYDNTHNIRLKDNIIEYPYRIKSVD